MEHVDSWKNEEVFRQQLERNLFELNSPDNYPEHWKILLGVLEQRFPSKDFIVYPDTFFLDVGCGCGAISELLARHNPRIAYQGIDYSQEAIDLANKQWPQFICPMNGIRSFACKDYKELDDEGITVNDVLHQSALCDVLPNGDECFDHLLSLGVPTVISQKMKYSTNGTSYAEEASAYGVPTYEYYHDPAILKAIAEKRGYRIEQDIDSAVGHTLVLRNDV